jgi:hypothetical protein
MSFVLLLILGIAFNVIVFLLSKGFRSHTTGIDSLPAFAIIAGFLYGTSAGVAAAVIISIAYYALRVGKVHYAPLTIILNVFVGLVASFLDFAGIFGAGLLLLLFYHLASFVVVGYLDELKPGYLMFIILNFITTLLLLFVAASLT